MLSKFKRISKTEFSGFWIAWQYIYEKRICRNHNFVKLIIGSDEFRDF